MLKRRKLTINISIAILVGSLCIQLSSTTFFSSLEMLSLDFLFRLRKDPVVTPINKKIVHIDVTDEDMFQAGRWPWSRAKIAEMNDILFELGADQILYDFLFGFPSTDEEDLVLQQSFRRSANAYIPYVFTTVDLAPSKRILPIESFRQVAKAIGHANVYPDTDGKIRRIPLFFSIDGKLYKHLALEMIEDYLNVETTEVADGKLVLSGDEREIIIPLDKNYTMVVNWQGRWNETFKHYDFLEVLEAYRDVQNNVPPKIDLTDIKDSISIVALTAIGFYDIKPNPLESQYPGVGLISNAISNILNQNFLKEIPQSLNFIIIYLFALLPGLYISEERYSREILLVLCLIGAFLLAYYLFSRNLIMNFSLPVIALISSYILVSSYNFARVAIEKKSLFRLATVDELTGLYNLRHFKNVLKDLCFSSSSKESDLRLTMMFCDIDRFKEVNDQFGHQAGDYVLQTVAQIFKSSLKGEDIVARYGGDEIVAVLQKISKYNAYSLAEKLRQEVENYDFQWDKKEFKVTVSLGISYFDPQEDDESSLIKRADEALYAAKRIGRNRVSLLE